MRILLVEDDQPLVRIITKSLDQSGFDVDVATDGEDGLHKARSGAYDSVVLDLQLPKMSGVEVCKTLREERNDVPILMLTARSGVTDRIAGLDAGADDYLPKPFSYPVLLAHLRSLTRRALGARPTVLSAAGLALDPASRTATRNGVRLELTTREVAVLEYLLRAAGRVVAKAELVEHCWDVNYDGDPAVVEVLMHRLRRKIEAADADGGALIETVRGQGYVIRERR